MIRSKALTSFILLLIVAFAFAADYLVRREVAKNYAEFTERFVKLGDFREVAFMLNNRLKDTFSAVALLAPDQSEILHLPPEHRHTSNFDFKFTVEVPSTNKSLMFWYSPRVAALLSFGFLLVLGGLTFSSIQMRERHIRNLALMEKKVEIADLLAQVSHDIRSPLSALNLAVGGFATSDTARHNLILSASKRINDIADSLLNHFKSGPVEQIETMVLNDLIHLLLVEKRTEFSGRDINLVSDLPPIPIKCQISAANLARTLSNLINNSVESGATMISLCLRVRMGKVIFTLSDNGPGIPKPILKMVGREPITNGKIGGSGLGLWSAFLFARKNGGSLSAKSSPQGTTLTLKIRKDKIHVT